MIFRFNIGQLEREVNDALAEILCVLQNENESELEIIAVEFPKKFLVRLDDCMEMIIVWDGEKKAFAGISEPELSGEPDMLDKALVRPEPEPESLTETKIEPEPVPNFALALEDVDSLAHSLVRAVKHFPSEQRLELYVKFYSALFKELDI